jgi:hypothetical protein
LLEHCEYDAKAQTGKREREKHEYQIRTFLSFPSHSTTNLFLFFEAGKGCCECSVGSEIDDIFREIVNLKQS